MCHSSRSLSYWTSESVCAAAVTALASMKKMRRAPGMATGDGESSIAISAEASGAQPRGSRPASDWPPRDVTRAFAGDGERELDFLGELRFGAVREGVAAFGEADVDGDDAGAGGDDDLAPDGCVAGGCRFDRVGAFW